MYNMMNIMIEFWHFQNLALVAQPAATSSDCESESVTKSDANDAASDSDAEFDPPVYDKITEHTIKLTKQDSPLKGKAGPKIEVLSSLGSGARPKSEKRGRKKNAKT